jgi:hypothetical protein
MQLPIGYDDFGKVIEKNLNYVDKSDFAVDVLEDTTTESIVITRPRRFGKTSNLSLLHYFLSPEVRGKSTQGMFDHLKIAQHGDKYMQHQGKYPVIFITFKDVKESTFKQAYESLRSIIRELYTAHRYLLSSDALYKEDKVIYESILQGNADVTTVKFSLKQLMQYLYQYHGVKPWLLIDEYDTPIQSAYSKGYYDEMIEFMRGMFGAALKNNPYLNRAVITGILRIAKESLFSGINNLKVYSILHSRYSEHFGFTEAEMDYVLRQSNLVEKSAQIKAWYNGYQMGGTTIYNPWSIANCVQEKGNLKPYWINTSSNELIKDLLKQAPLSFKTCFEDLMSGQEITRLVDENMVFADLNKHPDAIWSLLLMSGYLTPVSCEEQWLGVHCQLRVPNQEVNNLYRQIIGMWLSDGYGLDWYHQFMQSLILGNIAEFESHLVKVIEQVVGIHDLAKEPEAFFHGLLLGFIAGLQDSHEIKSNRESGLGRYDIMLIPKDPTKFGIIIELEAKGLKEKCSLASLAQAALKQIDEKHYAAEFEQRQIPNIIEIGIGFYGKKFALQHRIVSRQ